MWELVAYDIDREGGHCLLTERDIRPFLWEVVTNDIDRGGGHCLLPEYAERKT